MNEREWIESIPKFECSDGRQLKFTDEFIKDKLKKALLNEDIICLARGEGRRKILNDIVFHPEILFDWGEKSVHAFLNNKNEYLRRFCDPEIIDKDVMIDYITKYAEELKQYYRRYIYLRGNEQDVNFFLDKLIKQIMREDDRTELLCVKEWLIYALHTMGEKEFKKITPCISCSYGTNRFNTAQRFGRGYKNNYFVLMDCWVDKTEEGRAYKRTEYVNTVLGRYGLKWFRNTHNEIMLKYGIFPQKLVGYYLVDRNSTYKYVINRHYVDEWERNSKFEIGDPIYFEQIIDFKNVGPYNTIYEYDGRSFSIAARRR